MFRLRVVDESSFLSHSDISYDRTDDDVDLDTSVIKPLRPRAREKRRSSLGPGSGAVSGSGAADRRRGRSGNISAEPPGRTLEQVDLVLITVLSSRVDLEVETVVKASVQTPDSEEIHMEPGNTERTQRNPLQPPLTQQTHPQESVVPQEGDQTSVWLPANKTLLEPEPESKMEESVAVRALYQKTLERTLKHEFLSKTVIMPETCSLCGKRIRFGRMAVKCRTCRAVAHPECKMRFSSDCSTIPPQGRGATQNSLEDFSPGAPPWVPHLMVECVAEIERRGLQERGLYRVPGGERLVKELRMMVLQGKTPPLGKVQDVHVLCGFLKDFLRNLKEPLLTFRLHRTFMEAAELQDEDSSTAAVYRALSELPPPHRDTLAFLMLHLQKVVRSPPCQMDQNNLSRVFGPTLVGHGTPDPSPTTILRETSTQPKVVVRLLSLPEVYWRRVLSAQKDQILVPGLAQKDQISVPGLSQKDQISVPGSALGPEAAGRGRFFQPLTSPELSSCYRNPIRGTLRGEPRNPGLSNLSGLSCKAGSLVLISSGLSCNTGSLVLISSGLSCNTGSLVLIFLVSPVTLVLISSGLSCNAGSLVLISSGLSCNAGSLVLISSGLSCNAGSLVLISSGLSCNAGSHQFSSGLSSNAGSLVLNSSGLSFQVSPVTLVLWFSSVQVSPVTLVLISSGLSSNAGSLILISSGLSSNAGSLVLISSGLSSNAGSLVLICSGLSSNAGSLVLISSGLSSNAGSLVLICSGLSSNAGSLVLISSGLSSNAGSLVLISSGLSSNAGSLVLISSGLSSNAGSLVLISSGLSCNASSLFPQGSGLGPSLREEIQSCSIFSLGRTNLGRKFFDSPSAF
ncbi:hypothetical protein JOQ06_000132 [Pogonophryne albipinna]|uniref:Uncharacterized protein n=1 Tax=Pogonophryne albipinna TaxID=1090488 RepID=A0AAD6A794_9TELE|nr:hypothetical protein JOQ06_000132 [Pogonophryne albipinna]